MKKLIIHPGWSKTGTSAIQNALSNNADELLNNGIYYPKACQWEDHSHHHFALAFSNNPVHKSNFTAKDAVNIMSEDINSVDCEKVVISSELSPMYFLNPEFDRFIKASHFTDVEVVFTLREQSSLLVSMFNQLIKDPQVRSRSTLFETYVRISSWMNFEINIRRWEEVYKKENISIIPYGSNIVNDFSDFLGVDLKNGFNPNQSINASLPNEVLDFCRRKLRKVNDVTKYKSGLTEIIDQYNNGEFFELNSFLITGTERQVIYNHFSPSNNLLAKKYLGRDTLFDDAKLKGIKNYGLKKPQ